MDDNTPRARRRRPGGSRFRRVTAVTAAAAAAALAIAGTAWPARAQGTARLARAPDSATIDGAAAYQRIAGFGVSEGFGQAEAIRHASSAVQRQALSDLYSTTSGAGLTILRNEISADPGSTIEPTAPSSPSAPPTYVPLSSVNDDQGQLWLAKKIKAEYGVTNVFADAWSAPPFMKTNGRTDEGGAVCGVSGAVCSSGNWVQAYANYLEHYAADYAAAGVPLSYIGPENEANLSTSYDSMQLNPWQTTEILDVLGPAMAGSRLPTKVECCAAEGWGLAQWYLAAIDADPVADAHTAVLTSHGYDYGAPTARLYDWSKPVWESEWSTFDRWDPSWDDSSDASGLTWAQHIFAALDSANVSAFLYWWGSTTRPPTDDNESLIRINGSTVAPSGRLWAFGNFSRFVRPGAVRVGTATSDGDLTLDAFKNTDKTVTVVALNAGKRPDPVSFALDGTGVPDGAAVTPYLTDSSADVAAQATARVSGGAFGYTLPARSLVTFEIPALSSSAGNNVTAATPGSRCGQRRRPSTGGGLALAGAARRRPGCEYRGHEHRHRRARARQLRRCRRGRQGRGRRRAVRRGRAGDRGGPEGDRRARRRRRAALRGVHRVRRPRHPAHPGAAAGAAAALPGPVARGRVRPRGRGRGGAGDDAAAAVHAGDRADRRPAGGGARLRGDAERGDHPGCPRVRVPRLLR